MGYEVFVFNKYGHEIDFLAQKDGKEYLIQAARIPLRKRKPIKENLPCSIRWISHAERSSPQMNLTTQQVQSDILALQDF